MLTNKPEPEVSQPERLVWSSTVPTRSSPCNLHSLRFVRAYRSQAKPPSCSYRTAATLHIISNE